MKELTVRILYLSRVDNIFDPRNGERGFGNVCGDHTKPATFWYLLKNLAKKRLLQ